MSIKKGFIDSPIGDKEQDSFQVKNYVDGLVSFIEECNTPMTIAIQGDWGSGKTSLMNMISHTLGNNVEKVFFNTWKFSQFRMADDLAVTFLDYLVNEVSSQLQEKKDAKKIVGYVKKIGIKAGALLASSAAGDGSIGEKVEEIFDEKEIDAVDRLKDEFESIVHRVCEEKKVERIIFFIDDLDRLQPLRAVELLEVLKLFLDCEQCVFVLAIDYEVVSQGISQKYSGTLNENKSRKFFEKIIQVPFKMPTAHYNIAEYVKKALDQIGVSHEGHRDDYINIIQSSIGCNPRTMKRTFNAFLLLTKVHGVENRSMDELDQLLLFACLCMQLSFEEVYNYIVLHMEGDEEDEESVINEEFFETISRGELDNNAAYEELNSTIAEAKDFEEDQAKEFLNVLGDICLKNRKEGIDIGERLKAVLIMTSITSTNSERRISEAGVRRKREEKIMDETFSVHTLAELEESRDSVIGCEIEWYEIAGKRYTAAGKKIKMAQLLGDAITYAYDSNPRQFVKFRETLREKPGKDSMKTLFTPEDTKAPNSKYTIAGLYDVSTSSNNNQKIQHIAGVYKGMGIPLDTLRISLRFAHGKNDGEGDI